MGDHNKEHTGILKSIMNPSSITIKCEFDGSDLRRRTVELPPSGLSLANLRSVIQELFQLDSATNDEIKITYTDEDGDTITVGADADVAEAIRQVEKVLRLHATSTKPRPTNSTAVIGDLHEAFSAFGPAALQHLQHFASEFQSHPMRFIKQHMPVELQKQLKACGAMKAMKKAMKKKKCKLDMQFVEDLSLPDGSKLAPGAHFSKSWRVVNSGKRQWPDGTLLEHVDGELFEGSQPCIVPQLEPGQECELNLDSITAPAESGQFKSFWRLATPNGQFGERLWFDVSIANAEDTITSPVVHFGVICDATEMNPITGLRYKKIGADYDLCEEAFEALPKGEKYHFVCIDVPENAQALELKAQITHLADDVFQIMQGGDQGQKAYDAVISCGELSQAVSTFQEFAQAQAACVAAEFEWTGIWCDECKMTPLTGARFMKQLENDTFDLCQGCYACLPDQNQAGFKSVENEADAEAARADYRAEEAARIAAAEEATRSAAEEAACIGAAEEATCIAAEEAARIAEEAARAAEEEVTRLAVVEEAKAEACRLAVERVAAKATAEEAEAARIAAEEAEATRIAAEEVADATEEQFPLEWQGAVDALMQMGFSQSVAQNSVTSVAGEFEAALEAALAHVDEVVALPAEAVITAPAWNSNWDAILTELVEMGFENHDSNKSAIIANEGDLKGTVAALVAEERANRC